MLGRNVRRASCVHSPSLSPSPRASTYAPRRSQTDEQQSLVLQLQAVTRLTYAFAHLCLAQNAWDPHQALAQFQGLQAQGSIPAEAFLPV